MKILEERVNNMMALEGIVSLFLIMSVGVYASKKNIITKEINKGLTDLLLNITLPLLIISSFNLKFSDEIKMNIIICAFYSGVTLVVAIVISKLLLKPLRKEDKYIIQFSNVFSNCGFMGFPIIEGLYGKEGLIYASIFNVLFTVFMWTYGVGMFTGGISKENIKKVLVNPSIIAVLVGIIMMVFGVSLPSLIMKPIEMIGGMTSALSMIIVGVILSNVDFKEYMKDYSLYYGAALKLLIIPIVIYFVMIFLPVPTILMKIIVLLHAMPTAAMLPIFAESFGKDKEYASVLLFMTTLCCMVTFPVVLFIVG